MSLAYEDKMQPQTLGGEPALPAAMRKYLDWDVPRYTSYPTAASFSADVGVADHRRWIGGLSAEPPASLYVHIPYCAQLCWYCGCHARVANDDGPVNRYIDHLWRELALVSEAAPKGVSTDFIHFGGGTPSLLRPDMFLRLMGDIRGAIDVRPDAQIAIEADPRTMSPCKATAFAAGGVTRASFGVQDFSPQVQKAINRVQPFALVANAVQLMRDVGVEHTSLDLMYGLPHQTIAGVRSTAAQAIGLEPDRISVFGYAHVPHMKAHQRLIDEDALPGPDARIAQAEAIAELLTKAGYVRIGFDHYAHPDDALSQAMTGGRLNRNFQGYTDDAAKELIGIGASAISTFQGGFTQNTPDVALYQSEVAAGRLATARGVRLTDEDRLRSDVIRALLCTFEVDLDAVSRAHGVDPSGLRAQLPALGPLVCDGLAEVADGVVRVPEGARRFVRVVAAQFDERRRGAQGRFSVAV